MVTTKSPILWQNEDQTVALIDIPRSIAAAQGTEEKPCHDILISCQPREEPYPSQEPKSARARANLKHNTVDDERHAEYKSILETALEQAREKHAGEWCLPRQFDSNDLPSRKRKHDASDGPGEDDSGLRTHRDGDNSCREIPMATQGSIEHSSVDLCSGCDFEDPRFGSNCSQEALMHQVDLDDFRALQVPPYSSFFIGDLGQEECVRALHRNVRSQASAHGTPRYFDLILLDPPWPNRSVDRARGRSASGYSTAATLQNVEQLILGMDMDMLMADSSLVGIWVTNKPSLYDLVTESIFPQWGIELDEEWIWLKTTITGDPISAMDSLWRKPYEILLLGRRRNIESETQGQPCVTPKRRVILAVPDLHSRKPCLKALIEQLPPTQMGYRALEVFSRHLVAGWWSIGNECAKFNELSHWYAVDVDPEISLTPSHQV